ncbi:hypothetical protein ZYGR_0AI04310 [Zygosaccharomyces rouxii]|uniref:Histone chaperone RTT106 n=1 Tax=Zygosaccharomyces rouxii TaxID=4956 RepID=A0A1Q3ABL1_ZYGRO|nr:hypothetical protein ZYGR_0AI04310 [Zygosaccharomyces rouxii]
MDSLLNNFDPELRNSVLSIVGKMPESVSVFQRVYDAGRASNNELEPLRKSQKLENGGTAEEGIDRSRVIFGLNDVSVLSPLRKKLNLALHLSRKDRSPTLSLLRDGKQELSVRDLGKNITMAVFLPVAEKMGNIYLFIKYTKSVDDKYGDPVLITLNKESVLQQFKQSGIIDKEVGEFTNCIEYMRKQAILAGFRITDPFFTNSSQQSPSFHVECHRGTKEGTLYFLPEHLIFGFKKPILVFESSDIESITYTSITRLTFNVTLVTKEGEKFEFSMIDQSEYNKIDDYVKRKQVTDKSMSEELKAKSNYKNQQVAQSETNEPSALKEAAQLMEGGGKGGNLNGGDLGSDDDDEENDANFEAESGSSDGSDDESDEEEVNDEAADREALREERHDEQHEMEDAEAEEAEDVEQEQDDGGADDIPIELDDDDDGDDDEGSGVEYD